MSSRNTWIERFFKTILIFGSCCILVILKIIYDTGPASSYEFSIYDAYPQSVWVLLLSAIVCGHLVIVGSAMAGSRKKYWLFALFTILVSNALLLFIPVIRSYHYYGDGDVLTHVGYMKDILITSGFGGNHYPINHILGVSIQLISGLSLTDITHIIPPFFSFFFILSMYFVGKVIFQNNFEQSILVLLSSILILVNFHLPFTPNSQAIFLVPLILYLAFKIYYGVNNNKYYILLLLFGSLIVFYHPLVAIMVMAILSLMEITQFILEKYQKSVLKKVNYSYTIFFMLTVFLIWSSYLFTVVWVVRPIVGQLLLGEESIKSEFQKNFDLISKVMIDPLYLIKLIFTVYGHWIVLGILSLLCIGLILISIKNQKTKCNFDTGLAILGFIVFFMLSGALFFINSSFDFGRIYSFAVFFSLLLIPRGICLYLPDNKNSKSGTGKNTVKLIGILVIFFCITYFSTFSLYYSPITKQPNMQVPDSDYFGFNTFFTYRDDSLPILELGPVTYRFYDAIFGVSAEGQNINELELTANPPDHFGYQNETLSKQFFESSKYLVINDKGRGFYQNIYPEFEENWRFLPQDFELLKNDTKAQQIYSNGNLDIFKIGPDTLYS